MKRIVLTLGISLPVSFLIDAMIIILCGERDPIIISIISFLVGILYCYPAYLLSGKILNKKSLTINNYIPNRDSFVQVHHGDGIFFLINLSQAKMIDPISDEYNVQDNDDDSLNNDGFVAWWGNPLDMDADLPCGTYYGISYNDVKKLLNVPGMKKYKNSDSLND